MKKLPLFMALGAIGVGSALVDTASAQKKRDMTIDDLVKVRSVGAIAVSPDGASIAYTLSKTPDVLNGEKNGTASSHLYVATGTNKTKLFMSESAGGLSWTPDGSHITFLGKRGDAKKRGLYGLPVDGGEAKNLYTYKENISTYKFLPNGESILFIARDTPKHVKTLKEKGFDANVYEENISIARVYHAAIDSDAEAKEIKIPGYPTTLAVAPDGKHFAVDVAPTGLIDDNMMSRKIHVMEIKSGKIVSKIDTPGKIGQFAFSPDSSKLGFMTAVDRSDPVAQTLAVADVSTGSYNLIDRAQKAHVTDFAWTAAGGLVTLVQKGVGSEHATYTPDGQEVTRVAHEGFVASRIDNGSGQKLALAGSAPTHPTELFVSSYNSQPTKWTNHNEWTSEIKFHEQKPYTFTARDGLEVEGVLITPNGRKPRKGWPMINVVHGGPEAHDSNGWKTRYSTFGQIGAGVGFVVFYPNYRGSTGRGEEFAKLDHKDAPGDEFWDIVDGVNSMAEEGLIDKSKVGITGGSYGGFASAWGATIASEHFAAAIPFVALTDLISFMGTTDIPVEMIDVHFMKYPWQDWQMYLEKSPIYHAGKSVTPTLILHGEADPRVHPAQSNELYRYLKLNGQAPVRLVTYPGEGHGNRKAAGQYDYAQRTLRFMKHYLQGKGGDLPPADWGAAEKMGLED